MWKIYQEPNDKTNFKGDKSTSLLQLSLKETAVLEKKFPPFFFLTNLITLYLLFVDDQ